MKEIIDFIILIILYFILFYKKWRKRGREALILNTTMYIYVSFVAYFTIMPVATNILTILNYIIFNGRTNTMNLFPFVDLIMGRGDYIRQIILNIIMTIPFGFLIPLIKEKTTILKTILYTFLFSLSIELLQLITINGRSSDITDIITNIIGGIIGYILYIIMKPITQKILKLLCRKY